MPPTATVGCADPVITSLETVMKLQPEIITLTILNSIPTSAIMPRIQIHVINMGTKVINVNSIRP